VSVRSEKTATICKEKQKSLREASTELAARQRSAHTRRAYASTYSAFCDLLSQLDAEREPGVEAFTAESLAAYCEYLGWQGRSQSTLARHLSALRTLAEHLGLDEVSKYEIRVERLPIATPVALSEQQYEALVGACDTRKPTGMRDLAILRLLGDCGLRRSELCALEASHIVASEPEPASTKLLEIRDRCRARHVPLTVDAWEALVAWLAVRPLCRSGHIFVSLASSAKAPHPLSDRMVGNIVRKYAVRAGLPEHCFQPYALRHTFCSRLAKRGVSAEEIAEIAGHSDVRSARVYCNPLAVPDV
jgi:integrase/recombinase XerD